MHSPPTAFPIPRAEKREGRYCFQETPIFQGKPSLKTQVLLLAFQRGVARAEQHQQFFSSSYEYQLRGSFLEVKDPQFPWNKTSCSTFQAGLVKVSLLTNCAEPIMGQLHNSTGKFPTQPSPAPIQGKQIPSVPSCNATLAYLSQRWVGGWLCAVQVFQRLTPTIKGE